jgi:uncharacterized protein (DUF1501 family)
MTISRRQFLQLSASLGMLAGLGKFHIAQAAGGQDYKALVCLFMFGGNDGHNLIVPRDSTQYAAYQTARGALALPPSQLLDILDPSLGAFGLHYGLTELQPLFAQQKLAVLANVGVLVQPTNYANLSNASFPLPTNLRSHADQVVLMQTGYPNANGSSGWGGRTLDQLQAYNASSAFPVSISMNSPAIFCVGGVTQGVSLQPGNYLDQSGLNAYPPAASQARASAQQAILTADSGNLIVNAANKVMSSALALNPLLKGAASSAQITADFGSSSIGNQLKDIARTISLHSQLNIGRQVFFCSLGGFDTHSGQPYQQWDLLRQVSKALAAFYATLNGWGIGDQVTAFTLSDFGRTLQPSGSGTDHGWGNHHLILGGAVNGGKIYGRFPLMTNYKNFNTFADDYADTRGVMLPSSSLAQYGATLASWFGATDAQLNAIFPTLTNFSTRNLGFMA